MAHRTAKAGPRRGLWSRFVRTQAELEADELQDELAAETVADLRSIDACRPGQQVTVRGMVRSLTVRPHGAVPALQVDLYDGSGSLTVVWLGRRQIPGIDPGRGMVVHGRLTCNTDDPVIFNPRYELKPYAG